MVSTCAWFLIRYYSSSLFCWLFDRWTSRRTINKTTNTRTQDAQRTVGWVRVAIPGNYESVNVKSNGMKALGTGTNAQFLATDVLFVLALELKGKMHAVDSQLSKKPATKLNVSRWEYRWIDFATTLEKPSRQIHAETTSENMASTCLLFFCFARIQTDEQEEIQARPA